VGWNAGTGAHRPHEHPDVDSLGRLGQQLAEHTRTVSPDELEGRSHVPSGHVDIAAGVLDRLGDHRKHLGAVDEHVERAALAWRRIAHRPEAVGRRVEGSTPAEATEAPPMLGAHRRLDAVAHHSVEAGDG